MAKLAQLLNIEPANELKFQGPFRTAVASYMRLTNPTDHDICFKIKTTAPKKYCVRPNCGILEPKESQEIAIVLQPFIFDANEKNKHKFMVQSMVKPDDEDINLEDLWKKYPEKLMDSKLRCVFEIPLDNSQQAQQAGKEASISQKNNAVADNDLPFTVEFVNQKPHNSNNADDQEEESILMKDLKKLREDESALRQENLELKEQVLLLRLQVDGRSKEQRVSATTFATAANITAAAARTTTTPVHYPDPYSPPSQLRGRRQEHMEILLVVVSICTCIIGVLIGKFTYSEGSK